MFSKTDLKRLLIPLIIEQALAVTIGVADTVMVAVVGEHVVSGVSVVDAINVLLVQVFAALATGGAIVVAQYVGRGDHKPAREAAKQLVMVMTVLGLLFAAVCCIWCVPILRLVYKTLEPQVMQSAIEYFELTALSYPVFAIYNAGAALFRSQGNARVSMLTALMMNILNIGGNAIFLFQFHMGARAVGLGTLIARIVGAVVMLVLLRNQNNIVHIKSMLPLTIKPKMIATILRIGVPTGLENGMFQFGKLMVSGLISSFGTAAITANAVGNSISTLACVPGSAVGLGLITVVGQCMGAGKADEAARYTKQLLKFCYIIGAPLNLLIIAFPWQIVGIFAISEQAAFLAVVISVLHAGFWLVDWPLAFALPNSLRAAGDVRFTMLVSVASMWTFRIGFSYVFGQYMGFGLIGVWMAMLTDWLVRAVLFVWRFRSGKWKNFLVV